MADRAHASVYGYGGYLLDDEQLPVVSLPDEEQVEDLSTDVFGPLREEAESAQRLAIMRNGATYVRGRAELAVHDAGRKWIDERMFRVSQLFDWAERDPEDIVAQLRVGRVRARVSAAMGVGKSTKLPFYIARQMEHRVLYVAPDVDAISAVNKYVRDTGIGKIRRNWSTTVTEWVCCMTYHDFCGYAALSKRADVFKYFETIIMDEAFLKWPAVSAALKVFAVIAGPNTNLLLTSANISEDALDVMSGGQGTVKTLPVYKSPEEAQASGYLIDKYLVDRTMVVLPSDERAHDMERYYREQGVDAITLDTASTEMDRLAANDWLDGASSTPRVIVVTPRHALGFNFRVAFVILWPLLAEWVLDGQKLVYRERPMPRTLVNQGMSRAGRGIVEGAGGLVMGPDRADESYVSFADKIEEFVLLCACSIKPLRSSAYWAECYARFPNAIAPATAQQVKKINLPACVTMHYIGSDGYFAKKFHRGLLMFSQMDHHPSAGAEELPVGYEEWLVEDVFETKGAETCRVPLATAGEIQVILHAIAMIAEGHVDMRRWRLPTTMSFYDNADRGEETLDVTTVQRARLRRVRSFEAEKPAEREAAQRGWTYEAREMNDQLGGARTRRGTIVQGSRFEEAVLGMRTVVNNYVEQPASLVVTESEVGTVATVELGQLEGEVESPGGTLVCTLPGRLCTMLNDGTGMPFADFMRLIDAWRMHGNRLVVSKLFDCYGRPWTSVCHTLLTDDIVSQVVRSGVAPHVYAMVRALSQRFAMELVATVSTSHVFKKRFMGLFPRRPNMDDLMSAIRKGKFHGFAQSEAYMNRVHQLKYWLDETLLVAERFGVYLPDHITEAQRMLPVHARTAVGNVAMGNYAPPLYLTDNPMSPHWRPR